MGIGKMMTFKRGASITNVLADTQNRPGKDT